MSIEKPILKLYNTDFTLVALIDDYQQAQIEHNLYSAGAFSVSINYNIPNARLFQRGLFLQFGNNARDFCVIQSVENSIGSSGKGSEYITVSGYDCRYLFKRRIIKNLNSNDTWSMTAKGEICIRSLVADQCGVNAEEKRKLPITNIIPDETDAIGSTYSVSEAYSNLYDTLVTIATQSEIGWAVEFNGTSLNLVVYQGENKSNNVFFSTDFESLANGKYKDSNDSYSNSVYIGGKGTGSERDIYEGEVDEPEGLERFESYDNQSSMTTEEEYEEKARSILSQYGQTITVSGAGLAKCPYVFREQYDIGDVIKLSFSGKSANTQILSVSESWAKGSYSLSFNFGKPVNTLSDQLNIILRKIQDASNKSSATTSVKWYTTPTDTAQDAGDVTFNTLGFTGSGGTFTLYLDDEKTGSKSYHLYIKNLTASLLLTTGKGAIDLTLISGSYIANIFVDEDGNIINQGMTATNSVESGNTQPVTSDAVYDAISSAIGTNPDVSNATGVLSIAHGGTGETTAKGAEYNLIGGVETVETQPDDNRYIALRNQTVSASNGTFRWTKMSSVWAWIKSKIESVTFSLFNATTIKANGYQLKRYYEIDASNLSTNNFYPVTFSISDLELDCEIHSPNLVGSASYNQNVIHFKLIAQGWADTPRRFLVESYGVYDANEKTLGCIAYGNQKGANCIWLRGGMKYRFYCNREPILHSADYSNENEKFTVGTNYYGGSSNANITIVWTPGNYQSFYASNNIQASNFYGNLIGTADKIRTSAPSRPANGDIWIS